MNRKASPGRDGVDNKILFWIITNDTFGFFDELVRFIDNVMYKDFPNHISYYLIANLTLENHVQFQVQVSSADDEDEIHVALAGGNWNCEIFNRLWDAKDDTNTGVFESLFHVLQIMNESEVNKDLPMNFSNKVVYYIVSAMLFSALINQHVLRDLTQIRSSALRRFGNSNAQNNKGNNNTDDNKGNNNKDNNKDNTKDNSNKDNSNSNSNSSNNEHKDNNNKRSVDDSKINEDMVNKNNGGDMNSVHSTGKRESHDISLVTLIVSMCRIDILDVPKVLHPQS